MPRKQVTASETAVIAKWLKEARVRAGLTQLQAAARSGVGYRVVTRSEQGGDLLATNLVALAATYGGDLGELVRLAYPPAALKRVAEGFPLYDVTLEAAAVARGKKKPAKEA